MKTGKNIARFLFGAIVGATLMGCSGDPVTRVEVTMTGDAGKYKAPICVEVLWNSESATYTLSACSADDVEGPISTVLVGEPLNPSADSFERVGAAYMFYTSDSIVGDVTSVSDPEIDGSVAKINMNVKFEANDMGTGGSAGF